MLWASGTRLDGVVGRCFQQKLSQTQCTGSLSSPVSEDAVSNVSIQTEQRSNSERPASNRLTNSLSATIGILWRPSVIVYKPKWLQMAWMMFPLFGTRINLITRSKQFWWGLSHWMYTTLEYFFNSFFPSVFSYYTLLQIAIKSFLPHFFFGIWKKKANPHMSGSTDHCA